MSKVINWMVKWRGTTLMSGVLLQGLSLSHPAACSFQTEHCFFQVWTHSHSGLVDLEDPSPLFLLLDWDLHHTNTYMRKDTNTVGTHGYTTLNWIPVWVTVPEAGGPGGPGWPFGPRGPGGPMTPDAPACPFVPCANRIHPNISKYTHWHTHKLRVTYMPLPPVHSCNNVDHGKKYVTVCVC